MSTPTAAAELATPITVADLSAYLEGLKNHLAISTLNLLTAHRTGLNALAASLRFASPLRRIRTDRQRLDDYARRGLSALKHRLALEDSRLISFEHRLESLDCHASG